MGYVLSITRPKGLMCWCAESQMKWQCSEPTERNENIVFWINRNGVNLHRMWAKATLPAVLFRQCSGIFFKPAWQCFLCCGWPLKNRLYLFIYLYLLRLAWPCVPGCFSETPCFTHIQLHTFAPLGAKVFPLLFTKCFYLTSRVLIALLRVTSTKVTWECAGFFLCSALVFPVQGFEENSRAVKSSILQATLMTCAEIGIWRKAFWVSFTLAHHFPMGMWKC